uniref:hypothetical protein n=1 Tax=Psychrobacter sp. TaxID=56811 RepID=UPI0015EE9719|nr:hypothetical protein [Psychrobacter sp.]
MAALATTSSLSDYHRLSISTYRDQLRKSGKASSIDVAYSYRGKSYRYPIQLTTTAPHYGGLRHWFICKSCSNRASVLYRKGIYVCRRCMRLGYQSQLQTPIDRQFDRLSAIRERLEWQRGVAHGIGERPKGMHRTTYDKLMSEHEQLTAKVWQASLDKLNCTR